MGAALLRSSVVVLALALLWRVIHVNAVLYDDTGRPKLPTPPPPGVSEAAADRDTLVELLRENPANAAAYVMLAGEYERAGDTDGASRAYASAYQVAPVDRDVLASAATFFLRRGQVSQALVLLETAVEHYDDLRDSAFPVMAQSLASGREEAEWKAIIERGPAWLGAFVTTSCQRGVEPAILTPIFLSRVAAGKAQAQETACLVDHLRTAGRWDEAYQVWLDTLPRERLAQVGFIYNGGFEYQPSGVGFDWIADRALERDSGHVVEFARTNAAEGTRALRVSYNGKRQSGIPIAQYLVLRPGRYEVSGMARPESVRAGHGAHWTLRCVAGGKADSPIANSERFLGTSDWERFSFDATIPDDCPGQLLQLEAAATGEGPVFLAGTVWFDNLAIRQYH